MDEFVIGRADQARDTVSDDFRDRATAPCHDWHPTGERLRLDQAKRLRPVDRVEQRERVAEECRLVRTAHLTNKLNVGSSEQRLDLVAVVLPVSSHSGVAVIVERQWRARRLVLWWADADVGRRAVAGDRSHERERVHAKGT